MTSSNGNSSDRLDRIEAILESTATLSQQSNQRLDRLEQIAQTTLSIAQKNREDIGRTEQLTRRNAAAIARLDERMEQYIVGRCLGCITLTLISPNAHCSLKNAILNTKPGLLFTHNISDTINWSSLGFVVGTH
jgi:RNase P subunit RPR2